MLHSAIYKGIVWHKRFEPSKHAFRYKVFMLYLDLSEIDQVLAMSRWWSTRRFAPACYRRADFFKFNIASAEMSSQSELPIDVSVRSAVEAKVGFYPDGPIRLLTNLRYFGYIINPISCYYCFASDEPERMTALLIEVTNTPWGEKTHYVLDLRSYHPSRYVDFGKAMHVSPFMPMDMKYRWRGHTPGSALRYQLENFFNTADEPRRTFSAGVRLERETITTSSLNRILFQYPLMTARVAWGIYWQALRLAIKRIPFVPHPAR